MAISDVYVFRLLAVCIVSQSVVIEALYCFSCTDVNDIALCMTSVLCASNQSCFMQRTQYAGSSLYTLGCIENKQCGMHHGAGTIVGRGLYTSPQSDTSSCLECCSTYECNDQLCAHNTPSTCVDDETLDCAKLNSLLNVCADVAHAKTICPKFCNLCDIVDGNWSPWSGWSNCSVTCGNGTVSRTRACTNPPPAHGGGQCQGLSIEAMTCTRDLCPVHGGWTNWFPWETCSVTCGLGIQRRHRNCSNPEPSRFGDHCFGDTMDDRLCKPVPCSDGNWSNWGTWSVCSMLCGGGFQTRSRSCSNPAPSPFGHPCRGTNVQESACNVHRCLGDCTDLRKFDNSGTNRTVDLTMWSSRRSVKVFCDMTTDGGGWTVFQRRQDGTTNFYRKYTDYEDGFGNVDDEYWLGLKYIQELTALGPTEMRIDMEASDGRKEYELFQNFSLSPEPEYSLHLQIGSHHIGGSYGLITHAGNRFATYDWDSTTNCSVLAHSAGWFGECKYVNLNGKYVMPGVPDHRNIAQGIIYSDFEGRRSLKRVSMMLRRTK